MAFFTAPVRKPRLPEPDEFGNLWLSTDHREGPAIFPSKYRRHDGEVVRRSTYIVLVSKSAGFLWDGPVLRQFATPEEALAAIR